jgi:hypothetical protein
MRKNIFIHRSKTTDEDRGLTDLSYTRTSGRASRAAATAALNDERE